MKDRLAERTKMRLVEFLRRQTAPSDRRHMQQLLKGHLLGVPRLEAYSSEGSVIAATVSLILWQQKRMVHTRCTPERWPIRVVGDQGLEYRALLNIGSVVRIQADKQKPGTERIRALIGFLCEEIAEDSTGMALVHKCRLRYLPASR